MNIIKKYYNDAYRYVLLLIPANCICAGLTYTIGKIIGWYNDAPWLFVALFDFSQIIYLCISFGFIQHKKKVSFYSIKDISNIKVFVTIALFIQYNFIMHLFPTHNAWTCSFIFMGIVAFLFDTKLMITHIIGYTISLVMAHIIHSDKLLPIASYASSEHLLYCVVVYILTSIAFIFITYLVENFLIQEQEQDAENIYLMEKQLAYYQNCDYMDKELRKFRHDIKGHFIGMEYLLKNKSYDELSKYFSELNDSFSFQEAFYFSGNLIIDSILNHDVSKKCASHVQVHVSGRMDDLITVSSIDICTLFSNMLSNAINAANQCNSNTKSALNIYFNCGNKFFSIKITNSVPEGYFIAMPSKSKKGNYTLKRNHGHGIRKIKGICEKYNGDFNQTTNENEVTTSVYLPI